LSVLYVKTCLQYTFKHKKQSLTNLHSLITFTFNPLFISTVGYVRTNDPTMNKCYNERGVILNFKKQVSNKKYTGRK